MSTFGLLLIEGKAARWNRAQLHGYLSMAAVGVMSGILVAYGRTPIHMAGHKVVFWMAPVLASRLVTRRSAGASVGALAAAMTTLCAGGRIAGGVTFMPLVVLAGVVLDVAARMVEKRRVRWYRALIVLAAAGTIGNLICFVKRVFDPLGTFFSVGNWRDILIMAGSHAVFGFMAGFLGAGVGGALVMLGKEKQPPGNV